MTKHVATITVLDPDTKLPVEVEIRKDPESGAMIGFDGSFLHQMGDEDVVVSPYDGARIGIPDDENTPWIDDAESVVESLQMVSDVLTNVVRVRNNLCVIQEADLNTLQVISLSFKGNREWDIIESIVRGQVCLSAVRDLSPKVQGRGAVLEQYEFNAIIEVFKKIVEQFQKQAQRGALSHALDALASWSPK